MTQNCDRTDETKIDEDWLGVLDEHGVRFLLLDLRGDSDLLSVVRSQAGREVDFEDGEGVLLVRSNIV